MLKDRLSARRSPVAVLSEVLHAAVIGLGIGVLAAYLGDLRAPASLLLSLLAVTALMGAFPFTHRLLMFASFALIGLLGVCLLTPVLRTPLAALTVSQPPVRADAIVVLGGGVQCGTRSPEASSLARLMRGLELWRAGYAPVVTLSEQSGLIGPANCPKLSDIERDLVNTLYPQLGPTLVTLKNVTTTRDEAARVRELARTRGWQRILLVTSPSHSGRALTLFQRQGVNAVSVPALETRFDPSLPYPNDRLAALKVLSYEWISRLKAALGGTPER